MLFSLAAETSRVCVRYILYLFVFFLASGEWIQIKYFMDQWTY